MEDSIFTKIIRGEIPSHKIYEDEQTVAFLDINPANEGHTLVVPKRQVEFVWDLETDDYRALMETVQKVGRRLKEHYPDLYVGELVLGVDVPHAHVHVIPFAEPAQFKQALEQRGGDPDHAKLTFTAEKLSFHD